MKTQIHRIISIILFTLPFIFLYGCSSISVQDSVDLEFESPVESEPLPVPSQEPPASFTKKSVSKATSNLGGSAGQAPNRLIIYTADMTLVVDNISETLVKIRTITETHKGYMKSMDSRSIVIRIPASKFNKIVETIENFGEITHKSIKGKDVTEEMLDLNIRLGNAEKLRKRLLKLLDRAMKVEDAIEIERELSRVSETIERMKGKIRFLKNQISFSTITVHLNSPLPQKVVKEKIPFKWVRQIGREISKGAGRDDYYRSRKKGIRFKLPESFAKYYEAKNLTRATSAQGVLIKVQQHDNVEGATLTFWSDLISRSLLLKQTVRITGTQETRIGKNIRGMVTEGLKEIGTQKYAYLVCVTVHKKHVFTYEAWGETEKFKSKRTLIMESIRSLKF